MVLKLHIWQLLCHNGIPHLVHGTATLATREIIAAKKLDQRLTRLYFMPEPSLDDFTLVVRGRRYMNG